MKTLKDCRRLQRPEAKYKLKLQYTEFYLHYSHLHKCISAGEIFFNGGFPLKRIFFLGSKVLLIWHYSENKFVLLGRQFWVTILKRRRWQFSYIWLRNVTKPFENCFHKPKEHSLIIVESFLTNQNLRWRQRWFQCIPWKCHQFGTSYKPLNFPYNPLNGTYIVQTRYEVQKGRVAIKTLLVSLSSVERYNSALSSHWR